MGDLQVSPATLPNGKHHPPLSSQTPPPPNPAPSEIKEESWRRVEQATQEIIQRIQPTAVSEQRRRAVVEYVQKLIRSCIGTEVFPFGSVPLKTYLPDGDIDLTALGFPNSEDSFANDVRSVLEMEEYKKDTEFEVKDVQYINAEVKLVKCIVQNIVVDISFNQIGGLSTLCFLEMVDREIGKNHLFKRSIILIKAWCYYESRILGAHHGLISTYALETLVLYIFHLFHQSLDGPLAVLYRFLEYYSKFDWDNYCISFHGPVAISSLPELVAEPPETHGSHLLFSKEFLNKCVDMFSVPKGLEHNSRGFPPKHLNIVDPLKESNNLGRSVSKGNFYRIRSAFTYGAGKLGRILKLPAEFITDEVNMFFMNTLDRHGSGERPDVQDSLPSCSHSTVNDHSAAGSLSSDFKVENGEKHEAIAGSPSDDAHRSLCKEINKIKVSCSERESGAAVQLGRHLSNQHLEENWLHNSQIESNGPIEGSNVSDKRLAGDARDLATSRSSDSGNRESNSETGVLSSRKACHAPHLFFHPQNGAQNETHVSSRNLSPINKVSSIKLPSPDEEMSRFVLLDSVQTESARRSPSFSRNNSTTSNFREGSQSSNEGNGENGSRKLNESLDLSGDIDVHRKNLLYAQWCQEIAVSTLLLPIQQPSLSHYRNKHSWNAFQRQGMFGHMGAGPTFSPGSYVINTPMISGPYGTEDMPKPRGTGTYFPNTNYRSYRESSYRDRQSPRGRNAVPPNQLSRSRNNGRAEMPPDTNSLEEGGHEPPSQAQAPGFSGNGRGKPTVLDMPQSSRLVSKGGPHVNGFAHTPNGKLEFGTFGPVAVGISSPERGSRPDFISSPSQGSGPGATASTVQRPGMSSNRERRAQPYQLKDEGDFPPLTHIS